MEYKLEHTETNVKTAIFTTPHTTHHSSVTVAYLTKVHAQISSIMVEALQPKGHELSKFQGYSIMFLATLQTSLQGFGKMLHLQWTDTK